MTRTRRSLVGAALLLAAYAVVSIRRLEPPDRLFVLDAPLLRLAPRQVPPGWRFAPWLLTRITSFPSGPTKLRVDLSGPRAAVSREGASLKVEVDVTYQVDDAPRLVLHGKRGSAMEEWLSALVSREAVELLPGERLPRR